jgi:uncharacterized protein YjbI with pentapeptide repeats
VGKEAVACYRLYAANCVELAERTADADRRVFLLRMGQRWAKLAEQVEKAETADSDAASCHLPAASRASEVQASQAQASQAQASQAQASQAQASQANVSQANVSEANVTQANADDTPGDQIRINQAGVDQSGLNQTGDQNDGGAGVSSC